ncbi:protein AATF [Trichonephila clavipes]|nr:protein AATF [Trichonephila clavipes]
MRSPGSAVALAQTELITYAKHFNDKSSDDDDSVEETGDEVSYFEDDDGDVSEEEMKNFRKLIASKSKKSEEEDSYDSEGEEEDSIDSEGEEEDSIDSEDEVEESSDEEDEEETENKSSDEVTKQFSNIDVTSELEKSQAINNQREIMNNLLETRIKLQKLLITVNKLPQFAVWESLKEKGGKEFREQLSKGAKSINQVMKLWLNLQNELVSRNMEIQRSNCNGKQESENNDDEEIPSETDEEMDVKSFSNNVEAKGIKRKLKKEDYEMILAKHFKSLIPYRNSVIQKWDEKTKLSIGRTQKSFSAFDNSALKQIEQVR